MTELLPVTVQDMAQARERRALKQQALLKAHGKTLICLTMNIAGNVKLNGLIKDAFHEGVMMVSDILAVNHVKVSHHDQSLSWTGPEAFFCVDSEPLQVKRLMVRLEDRNPLGRLLDIDVLGLDGTKVSRTEVAQSLRKCLLCEEPVTACARSRRHSAEELFTVSMLIIQRYFDEQFTDDVSSFAVRALLTELAATPKPGMVDRKDSGCHRDMDFFTFLDSAAALTPYFHACVRLGAHAATPEECFISLRAEGALAEGRMLRVTKGVNTHKGAVFSLGILCAAAGYAWNHHLGMKPEVLSAVSSRMTAAALQAELDGMKQPQTFGETLMKGRLAGARAEAAQGFPTVLNTALPALEKALEEGRTLNDACICALMAVMSVAEDSVLLRRAGPERSELVRLKAKALLKQDCPDEEMKNFDEQCTLWNISFGGSADLLAAALLMRFLRDSRWQSDNTEESLKQQD